MAYAPIAKIEKFTGKKDDAQVWLNDYQSLVIKSQTFQKFKTVFLGYFSNNNSINCLINTFITIKQRETKAVTTYLEHFHRNLCQIQAIQADYFKAPQILNQFIRGLRTKLKANYVQAVNLVMNRLSELDSKLKQFSDSINQKLEGYLADNHKTQITPKISCVQHYQPINCGNRKCILLADNTCNLSTAVPVYLSAAASNNLSIPTNSNTTTKLTSKWNPKAKTNTTELEIPSGSQQWNLGTGYIQNPNVQQYLSLLVIPEDVSSNNQKPKQKQPLTSNIPPATISNNEFLAAIFFFELKETTPVPLFSGTTFDTKPITVMYTNVKVDGHINKLILDSHQVDHAANTCIITTNGTTKTPISEINDLPIEINGIIVPIKILVMEATQYQALVGNNWLSKTNYQQHMATSNPTTSLYQVLWADNDHNELPPILSWDNNGKEKQKKGLIWSTNQILWADNNYQKLLQTWKWKENNEKKEKTKEEETVPTNTTNRLYIYIILPQSYYCRLKLICINCDKKLLSISVCCDGDKEYSTATKFYCCMCIIEHFEQPKWQGKWNNKSCLACEETLLDEEMWNDILGRERTCDASCQYTILISNWVRKETPMEAAWKRAIQ
ncbi:hypothetical protein G9A89_013400 [Geosiphon pyriformis]|nr:hypothetical protein G9A89_013400 [Geosiphon pyriformis]